MKRVVIAPDSFKGTLSAVEVCGIISAELKKRYTDIYVMEIPVADGGEGTVDAFLYASGGDRVYCTVKSPLGRDIRACYGILPDGTAIIEMAQASGIMIEKDNDALRASTYGTGQLISDALTRGCRKILIGIGGSATTDGGIGCVSSLGGRFLNAQGKSVPLCGEGLSQIKRIDLSELDERLKKCEIKVLCDVKNPLYGKDGAAYVYSPQKGADKKAAELLDRGLNNLAKVSLNTLGKDYSSLQGAGAAGGLGFGLVAFCGAKLTRGIDCILEAADFCEKVKNADLVITGEGKMDSQSLMGKVPFGIAEKSNGRRIVAVVGVSEVTKSDALRYGISEIIETNSGHLPFDEIKNNAKLMLIKACEKIEL